MPIDGNGAFTLILEPVKRCNLSCLYCYSDGADAGVMSRHTLQTAFEKTARYAERHGFREIHILWHGGEPLLAGLGFFRAAIKILEGLSSDLRFHHFLQTNSLLLDYDFCAFFRDHEFQIGHWRRHKNYKPWVCFQFQLHPPRYNHSPRIRKGVLRSIGLSFQRLQ